MLSDSILGLTKCPNRKKCTFTFMHLPVGALPEVQNWIWKHFSHKVLYNYFSFFNKVKQWISHCIFKSCVEGFRVFFFNLRSNFFLPNGLYLPTKQPWGFPKFWFWYHIFYTNYMGYIPIIWDKAESENVE